MIHWIEDNLICFYSQLTSRFNVIRIEKTIFILLANKSIIDNNMLWPSMNFRILDQSWLSIFSTILSDDCSFNFLKILPQKPLIDRYISCVVCITITNSIGSHGVCARHELSRIDAHGGCVNKIPIIKKVITKNITKRWHWYGSTTGCSTSPYKNK